MTSDQEALSGSQSPLCICWVLTSGPFHWVCRGQPASPPGKRPHLSETQIPQVEWRAHPPQCRWYNKCVPEWLFFSLLCSVVMHLSLWPYFHLMYLSPCTLLIHLSLHLEHRSSRRAGLGRLVHFCVNTASTETGTQWGLNINLLNQ